MENNPLTSFPMIISFFDANLKMVVLSIDVYQSHEPDMLFVFSPAMSLIEFLIYVGNTISFWFGLSVLDVLLRRTSFAIKALEVWSMSKKGVTRENEKVKEKSSSNHMSHFKEIELKMSQLFQSVSQSIKDSLPKELQ